MKKYEKFKTALASFFWGFPIALWCWSRCSAAMNIDGSIWIRFCSYRSALLFFLIFGTLQVALTALLVMVRRKNDPRPGWKEFDTSVYIPFLLLAAAAVIPFFPVFLNAALSKTIIEFILWTTTLVMWIRAVQKKLKLPRTNPILRNIPFFFFGIMSSVPWFMPSVRLYAEKDFTYYVRTEHEYPSQWGHFYRIDERRARKQALEPVEWTGAKQASKDQSNAAVLEFESLDFPPGIFHILCWDENSRTKQISVRLETDRGHTILAEAEGEPYAEALLNLPFPTRDVVCLCSAENDNLNPDQIICRIFPEKIHTLPEEAARKLRTKLHPRFDQLRLPTIPKIWLYLTGMEVYTPDGGGFWVKGDTRSEIYLRSQQPIRNMPARITSLGDNKAHFYDAGGDKTVRIKRNEAVYELMEPVVVSERDTEGLYLYKFSVKAEKNYVPSHTIPGSEDHRPLGIRIEPKLKEHPAVSAWFARMQQSAGYIFTSDFIHSQKPDDVIYNLYLAEKKLKWNRNIEKCRNLLQGLPNTMADSPTVKYLVALAESAPGGDCEKALRSLDGMDFTKSGILRTEALSRSVDRLPAETLLRYFSYTEDIYDAHSVPLQIREHCLSELGRKVEAQNVTERLQEKFTPEVKHEFNFDNVIRFAGYDPPVNIKSGKKRLTLYWQSIKPVEQDYSFYVHIFTGPSLFQGHTARLLSKFSFMNTRYFQLDHSPLNGQYPSSRFIAGEKIKEVIDFIPPESFDQKNWKMLLGVWNPKDGSRLNVIKNVYPRIIKLAAPE